MQNGAAKSATYRNCLGLLPGNLTPSHYLSACHAGSVCVSPLGWQHRLTRDVHVPVRACRDCLLRTPCLPQLSRPNATPRR